MTKRRLYRLTLYLFVLLGIVFGILQFTRGEAGRGVLGLASVLFLLVPRLIDKMVGGTPSGLYIEAFAFCILAYDFGCVLQLFDSLPYFDKVSHFLSGFVFTTIGYCLFLWLRRKSEAPIGRPAGLGVAFGVFFANYIAIFWEVFEFLGFVFAGHDSQHHLDTGVFDTMGDLISCLIGSLLCAGSLMLFLKKGRRLPAGAIAQEMLDILKPKKDA